MDRKVELHISDRFGMMVSEVYEIKYESLVDFSEQRQRCIEDFKEKYPQFKVIPIRVGKKRI